MRRDFSGIPSGQHPGFQQVHCRLMTACMHACMHAHLRGLLGGLWWLPRLAPPDGPYDTCPPARRDPSQRPTFQQLHCELAWMVGFVQALADRGIPWWAVPWPSLDTLVI